MWNLSEPTLRVLRLSYGTEPSHRAFRRYRIQPPLQARTAVCELLQLRVWVAAGHRHEMGQAYVRCG